MIGGRCSLEWAARGAGAFLASLTVLLGPSTSLAAQEGGDPGGGGGYHPWASEGIVAVRAQVGKYGYDAVPALPGLKGETAWKLGFSLYPGPPFPGWIVGLDFDVWGVSRSYTSVLEGAAESETELTTNGFGIGARIGLPVTSTIGFHVLGGFTYVDHVMKVEMLPAWFLPNLPNSREEEGGGWGPYWGLAADVRIRDFALGIEQRWVRSTATFDEQFSMTDLPLGGSTLYVGLGLYVGRTKGGVRPRSSMAGRQ